jgi:hypothetical protein
MITLFVCAVLGQFKEGDTVSVKPPGAHAWKTPSLAGARYQESPRSGDPRNQGRDLVQSLTTYYQGREKLTVLALETIDSEKIVKVRDGRNETWWMLEPSLAVFDDQQRLHERRDGIAANLRPFCVTKPEHDALTAAVGKGLDPLTMTSKDAAALSGSERRALSSVKARYIRANGKTKK